MPTRAPPRSLADHAAAQIRQLIIDGTLPPGQALSETALAARLGVSKTPIREALLRLATERLVHILPQKGTFVFRMGVADAEALSAFRSLLEVEALRIAMRRDAAGLAEALTIIVARMKPGKTKHEARNYRALDDLFHRAIIAHGGNAYLSDAYENVALLVQTLRNRLGVDPQLNVRSLKDHKELLRQITEGRLQKAVALLKDHIAKTPADYASRAGPCNDPRHANAPGTPVTFLR